MKNNSDPSEESRELTSILEQKFSEMNEGKAPAPPELKEDVFNTLNSLLMVGDLVDLFVVKFAHTELSFLEPNVYDTLSNQNNHPE